jgi:hypothetical protein
MFIVNSAKTSINCPALTTRVSSSTPWTGPGSEITETASCFNNDNYDVELIDDDDDDDDDDNNDDDDDDDDGRRQR